MYLFAIKLSELSEKLLKDKLPVFSYSYGSRRAGLKLVD